MSISTPTVNSAGQAQQGTSGSSISNNSATQLNSNEFLQLMMDSLQDQDPLSPSSSDPTQYLSELAQMTDVEQETSTAQSTTDTAQEVSVSQAISMIGDNVSYVDQTTGATVTGTVSSVQVTGSGPTLTVSGASGIALSSITNVTGPAGSSSMSPSPTTSSQTNS